MQTSVFWQSQALKGCRFRGWHDYSISTFAIHMLQPGQEVVRKIVHKPALDIPGEKCKAIPRFSDSIRADSGTPK
jgi:hypothetical protein